LSSRARDRARGSSCFRTTSRPRKSAPDSGWSLIAGGSPGSSGPIPRIRGGDRAGRSGSNGWALESKLAEEAAAEVHLGDLLDRVGDAADEVASLTTDPRIHSVLVRLGHHTDNENPGFSLNPGLVERLVRLGAGLEIDVYVGSESG